MTAEPTPIEASLPRTVARAMPGWLWMVLTACFFATMGSLVKVLVVDREVSVFWIGFVRFSVGGLSMLIPSLAGAWPLKVVNRRAFVWRGILGAGGMFLLFVAIAHVGLGRGTVLSYLMGVVGAVSGIFILNERLRLATLAAVVVATLGVMLACRAAVPQGPEWFAVATGVLSGVTLSIIRLMRRTDTNQAVFFSQGVFGTIMLLPLALFDPVPTGVAIWALILAMTTADILGQLCMTQGLSMLPVAKGGALMMLTPILSLMVGVALFDESLSMVQWLGCALVLGASLVATVARADTSRSK